MLKPHRDSAITAHIHTLLRAYLTSNDSFTVHLRFFDRAWPGTPSNADIKRLY